MSSLVGWHKPLKRTVPRAVAGVPRTEAEVELMGAGVVPGLLYGGRGNIHDQAHLLLGRWKLGLGVPSCLLCLS